MNYIWGKKETKKTTSYFNSFFTPLAGVKMNNSC